MLSPIVLKESMTKPLSMAVKKTTRQSNMATGKDKKLAAVIPRTARKIKKIQLKRGSFGRYRHSRQD